MTDLTDRVVTALMEDSELEDANIDVSSSQNIVTLTGNVKTAALRDAAEEIARRQEGVTMVVNEIKVG
jgi:osmotically-inducible protein OsmY